MGCQLVASILVPISMSLVVPAPSVAALRGGSADLESAVSQDCILPGMRGVGRVGTGRRTADCPASSHLDATADRAETGGR